MSGPVTIDAYAAWFTHAQLGVVTDVADPERRGRVKVRMHSLDPEGNALLWARVAVAFAGDNYGAFSIPDVGEEVLIVFTNGDVNFPVVIGSLWTGATEAPEEISGATVDRWTITGKAGTRIAIVEETAGPKVEIETPNGAKLTLTDQSAGEIELEVGSNRITMGSAGVAVETASEFSVRASSISLSAGTVSVDCGMATFSNLVSCSTLNATSVISSSYTPGAGNIW